VNAKELNDLLADICEEDLNAKKRQVLGLSYDRASVNRKAYSLFKNHYNKAFGIGCFSHTLANVGNKMHHPLAKKFLSAWKVIIKSPLAKHEFRVITQQSIKLRTFNNTRWWSWWEVLWQVVAIWSHILVFLANVNAKVCTESVETMKSMLADNRIRAQLLIELAVVAEYGFHLCRATYKLEGML
jgi:hypothetical protein